jgi:hypothetical protein
VSDKSIHLESSLSCQNEFSLFVCVWKRAHTRFDCRRVR